MNKPTMPKTPPLAPSTVLHPFSNAALKKFPTCTKHSLMACVLEVCLLCMRRP